VTPPSRLLILAPNWRGDAVMALPLIADVHRAWPNTEIVMAARRSVAPLYAMVPAVSHTVTLAGGGGWRGLASVRENVATLMSGAFDAALLLPNSFQAAWVVSRAGIPERWGFARDLRGRLLTRVVPRPSSRAHQSEYYQALGAGLGVPVGDRFARLEVRAEDRDRARALLAEAALSDDRRVFVFAPGAAYGRAKEWLPERFAELATLLANAGHATALVGSAADASVCGEIATRASNPAVIDLAGRTDLPTLAALMSLAGGVVANDSGAMHLAAAAGAHVVAVFGPTDDRKTSPLRSSATAPEPTIVSTTVWCRPCMLRECPIDHRCMTGVSARQVFDALAPL
jgi:heptosyltransferase-2